METRDARRWMLEKFVHHLGEMWRMDRATTARGRGLPAAEFAQPQAEPVTNIHMTSTSTSTPTPAPAVPATPPAGKRGHAGAALLCILALLATVAGGSLVLLRVTQNVPPPTIAVPSTAPAKTPQVDPIELELQWWTDEKGQVHFGQPRPVKSP